MRRGHLAERDVDERRRACRHRWVELRRPCRSLKHNSALVTWNRPLDGLQSRGLPLWLPVPAHPLEVQLGEGRRYRRPLRPVTLLLLLLRRPRRRLFLLVLLLLMLWPLLLLPLGQARLLLLPALLLLALLLR